MKSHIDENLYDEKSFQEKSCWMDIRSVKISFNEKTLSLKDIHRTVISLSNRFKKWKTAERKKKFRRKDISVKVI